MAARRDETTAAPAGGAARVRSMRAMLFTLVLLAIVPSALLSLAFLFSEYRDEVVDSRAQALARARAVAAAVDSQLLQIQAALHGLSTSNSLQDNRLADFHERARLLQAVAGVTSVTLVDPNGRQLVNTMLPFGAALPQLDAQAPSTVIVREGRPIARMTQGVVSGRAVAIVGVPVHIAGELRYGLSTPVGIERFDRLMEGQRLPAGWIGAIVDDRGQIAWRNISPEKFVGKPATAALRARMASAPEGAFEAKSLDGVDTLTVYALAPQTGWTVVFGIPQAALYAGFGRSLAWFALGTAFVLGLAAWTAWAYGQQIVRSTASLVNLSRDLARSEDVMLPPLEFREALELGESMVDANRKLHKAYADVTHEQERLHALLEAATDGVIVVDAQGRIVKHNAAACRMFARDGGDMDGRAIDTLLPGEGALLDTAGRTLLAVRADGSQFPAEAAIAGFEAGGEAFRVAIVRDVTERQRVEDELLRSNLELRQFAHAASHDMRSPLRSIIGMLSVVAEDPDGPHKPRSQEFVARALRAARQLDRLTEDLLAYARLESPAAAMAPVDLEHALASARHLLESEIEESGAQITAGPLPTVQGHASQITQLFQNLLGNAIKFRGEEAPRIRITAEPLEAGWRVDVADNGIGIAAEYRDKVFEMFQRLHAQSAVQGSGIGLALCRKIVQRHSGRIWVDSEPGRGSTFHFTLHEGSSL